MAGAVDNEDRVTTAAAIYDGEASAEDYGDRVEDVMGGGSSGGDGSSNNEQRRQQRRQRRHRQ